MPIKALFAPSCFDVTPGVLTLSHFHRHPIWAEYIDFEEREDICSWGVDRVDLDTLLACHDNGTIHPVYTVLRPYPLPEHGRLYFKAHFETPLGNVLDGYIMNEDAKIIEIFVGNDSFPFYGQRSTVDLDNERRALLQNAIARPNDPIFPLSYDTDFLDSAGNPIPGDFSLTPKDR